GGPGDNPGGGPNGENDPEIVLTTAINAINALNPTTIEDANDPDNPRVLVVGTEVAWTYLVTNPGEVSLTITSLTDDAGTINDPSDDFSPRFVGGDDNQNALLDPGEVWLFTSEGEILYTVTPNEYSNLGTVEGITTDGQTVTASDPTYHIGNESTLFVQKAINAVDPLNPTATELAQSAPGRPLPVGTEVVWTYTVSNLGEGPIQITGLRDDAGTPLDTSDDFSPTPVLMVGTNFNLGDLDRDGLLDPNETWLYRSQGTGSGTAATPDWERVFQDVLNATDTSGLGVTAGFVEDPVNSNSTDDIFTGGQSKDTAGVHDWRWETFSPQDKDDIAHVFGASYADAETDHQLLFTGLDRYAANGNATVGFWFFQQPVGTANDGTFTGEHTDGDLLFVVDFTVGGSTPVVNLFRWTGTDAEGELTPLSAPTGATFAEVNSDPVSVPWSFIDKQGFTSPQAGEFLQVGVDLTALFGDEVPNFASFLAETRSSQSTTATLSDFAIGSVNIIHTNYRVTPGPYSNTVTVFGIESATNGNLTATATNHHHGVLSEAELAASQTDPLDGNLLKRTDSPETLIATEFLTGWMIFNANSNSEISNSTGISNLDIQMISVDAKTQDHGSLINEMSPKKSESPQSTQDKFPMGSVDDLDLWDNHLLDDLYRRTINELLLDIL
ncbi:MAG: hypothetical protein KDA84_23285, partial [Planctomycetaceae bacterium]|nr:hypothetical protein [Planctomycetaceae bacterium]